MKYRPEAGETEASEASEALDAEEFAITLESVDSERARIKAIIEAVIYITDEPLSAQQIAGALNQPIETIKSILDELTADYAAPDRGLNIREVAGGYKMATKPEHHEEIRAFVKNLKPPLKLSLAALETLAVIAYKQPITAPEIMEIRGVQGAGVLKTLLDRKLIATAGRKNVIGKPILYKTTREFLRAVWLEGSDRTADSEGVRGTRAAGADGRRSGRRLAGYWFCRRRRSD